MTQKVKGLVLQVTNYKESDRRIVILTESGLFTAYAKAARNLKSKKFAATAPFCYSEFLLFEGKGDMYSVNEAEPIEVFYPLREDVERVALAQYFCELLMAVTPESGEVEDFLRLALNSLHFLSDSTKNAELVKTVFELRLMCFAGFMPNLVACNECAIFASDEMYFDSENAVIYCSECRHKAPYGSVKISSSALSVMRHIVFSDFHKIFSFTASDTTVKAVSKLSEDYVKLKAEKNFQILDYYYSVKL